MSRALYFLIVFFVLAVSATHAAGTWTLATADTRIRIAVHGDHLWIQRLECPSVGCNWAGKGLDVPLMRTAAVNGKEVQLSWKFTDGRFDPESGTLALSFTNADPKLGLKSFWRARPGHGAVEHWIEIENRSPRRVTVTRQDSLSLIGMMKPAGLPLTAQSVRKGGSQATLQGGTCFDGVDSRLHKKIESNPDDGASYVPWLRLQAGDKHGLYVGWEFSGIGGVRVDGADSTVDVTVGNNPDFKTDIEPQETFLVPAAFVGCYAGDADEGSYTLARFVAEKLIPPVPKGHVYPTVTWNPYADTGMGGTTEATLLPSIKRAKDFGFETFVVDASWYPQVGDWRWDPARFPHGGAVFADCCHKLGLDFGMWCAWGQAGESKAPGALSARARPNLFTFPLDPNWKPSPGDITGQRLCLGCPDATQWAKRETARIVKTNKLDFFKHDCGPITTSCSRTTHKHHYGTDVSYWAARGYYEVMDNLRRECPNVVLENCSGGGLLKDFGAIKRAHYICGTDTLQSLTDRDSAWDTTWVLPPATIMLYTYDNTLPLPSDKPGPFLWRSAMMGSWICAPTDSAKWSDPQNQSVTRAVEIFKWWIRPILRDCKVMHILPRPTDKQWDGLFYWSPGLGHGIAFIFRPDAPNDRQTIKLRSLDRARSYWVWSEDGSTAAGLRTGAELMDVGLTLSLPDRYTSDLIYVQDSVLGKPEGLDPPREFGLGEAQLAASPFSVSASLRWQPSKNARSYRVQVSRTPDFKRPLAQAVVYEPHMTIGKVDADCKLYWKVQAVGWGGERWNSGSARAFVTPNRTILPGVTFVSDMKWIAATCGSDVVHRDENYTGSVLSIAGKPYLKGVWTHAFNDNATPADVKIDIAGKGFATFVADVGIDDASFAGSVVFQVLADGKVVSESPLMHKGAVHKLVANVSSASVVTLRVTNGGDGNACDHAAWGFARFITSAGKDPLP